MTELVRKWLPLVVLSVILLRLTLAAALPLEDPDVWWHLRLGNEFRHGWSLLHPDQLSTFATVRWAPTQWLPEVAASWVEQHVGLPGVAWLYGAGLVGFVLSVFVVCRRRASLLPAVLATGLAVGVATASLSPRPQIISFALLALTVGAWLNSAESGRPPWLLVPLTWVWAMCHGMWFTAVLVGIGVVLAMALERSHPVSAIVRAALVPVASLLVAALTPAGPRLLGAPFAVGVRRSMITEWQQASWQDGPVLIAIALLAFLAVMFLRRRPTWVELALVAMAAVWLVASARTVALAGVLLAPVLASRLQELLGDRAPVIRTERLWVATTVTGCLAVLAGIVGTTADEPANVPLALDPQLTALPDGTAILNTWTLGGWLEWRHPRLEPVVDGLAEAYRVEHLRAYIQTLELRPGWQKFVTDTGVTAALLAVDDRRLAEALQGELGWRQLGEDEGTVLLVAP